MASGNCEGFGSQIFEGISPVWLVSGVDEDGAYRSCVCVSHMLIHGHVENAAFRQSRAVDCRNTQC